MDWKDWEQPLGGNHPGHLIQSPHHITIFKGYFYHFKILCHRAWNALGIVVNNIEKSGAKSRDKTYFHLFLFCVMNADDRIVSHGFGNMI